MLVAGAGLVLAAQVYAQESADRAAIRNVALDYVEGWYTGDTTRSRTLAGSVRVDGSSLYTKSHSPRRGGAAKNQPDDGLPPSAILSDAATVGLPVRRVFCDGAVHGPPITTPRQSSRQDSDVASQARR